MQAQVAAVAKVLDKYESQGLPWLIGGDFNLLPLGQYRRLPAEQRTPYSADSELHLVNWMETRQGYAGAQQDVLAAFQALAPEQQAVWQAEAVFSRIFFAVFCLMLALAFQVTFFPCSILKAPIRKIVQA